MRESVSKMSKGGHFIAEWIAAGNGAGAMVTVVTVVMTLFAWNDIIRGAAAASSLPAGARRLLNSK